MELENVLNLFDSYWHDLDFFKRTKPTKYNNIPELPSSNNNLNTLPTIHTSSSQLGNMSSNNEYNSELLSDFSSSSSPNSVLQSPKLQTIFSGKESNDFDNQSQDQKSTKIDSSSCSSLRRRKKKGLSKSLSDLEFEELKGFMDLGFVFSQEDNKDSTLVSIIPGLQRLLGNENDNNTNNNVKLGVSRPYLSEAWEVLEKKKKERSLLEWKVPASNNQVDMKDYLKSWAHNIASTLK